jgi:hypothetical protein
MNAVKHDIKRVLTITFPDRDNKPSERGHPETEGLSAHADGRTS